MIDFVKIAFRSPMLAEQLLNRDDLEFFNKVEERTGQIRQYPKVADFHYLKIFIHNSGRIEVHGSLHKFYHGNNYGDFTFQELCNCLHTLTSKLGIPLKEASLANVEFGVNLITPFCPTEFYRYIIAFKDQAPARMGKGKVEQVGIDFYKQQYGIKVYDKGKQSKQPDNILRFEVKVLRMQFLKKVGIASLNDLLDIKKLLRLKPLLLEAFNLLIIDDEVEVEALGKPNRKIYQRCQAPKEWEDFKAKKRTIYRRKFNSIIQKHGANQWQRFLDEKIAVQWDHLAQAPIKQKKGMI